MSAKQLLFEQVEAKPQALEWIFSVAAGIPFFISADNLARNNEASFAFKERIHTHALHYLEAGLPLRARLFTEQLLSYYQRHAFFQPACFERQKLGA